MTQNNSVSLFYTVLQNYPQPCCIIIISPQNTNYTFDFVNPTLKKILEELSVNNLIELFDKSIIRPKNFFRFLNAHNKIEGLMLEYKVHNRIRSYNIRASNSGELTFITFEDVTEQIIMQRKLSMLADVFNFFGNPLLIAINEKGVYKIADYNRAFEQNFGYTSAELKNKNILKLRMWNNTEILKTAIKKLEDSRDNFLKDIVADTLTKKGKILKTGIIINAVKNLNGETLRLIIMLSDITTRID